MKTLLLILTVCTFSISGLSQNNTNEPFCTILVHYTNTPPLLSYLFSKYGVEDSERITTNIQNYELENGVTVMDDKSYLEYIGNINQQLIGQTESVKISILESEKLKVINILTIEAIVSQ
jgi:hypothetical protein